MSVLVAFAFISGIITILSPCILPVLPIVLSGGVGGGRRRPYGIVSAFVASFTLFTLALSTIVDALGIPAGALRLVSVIILVLFGLVMLLPVLRDRFERAASRLTSRSGPAEGPRGTGFWSGVPVGLSLGLVWTPCVGPIMASVISLALTRQVDGGSVLITLAYALGTSLPMLAVMFGGRALISAVPGILRNMVSLQRVFGALMIAVGLVVAFGWDRSLQSALLRAFPTYGSGLTAIEQNPAVERALNSRAASGGSAAPAAAAGVFAGATTPAPPNGMLADYGAAPPLVAQGPWYNTGGIARRGARAATSPAGAGTSGTTARGTAGGGAAPLTMKELRGKVVLIDFWTYSCVNCVRTLPHLKAWYKAYKRDGLVIIGIHTPEFEFEKVPRNVRTAIAQLGITWPVVQDNTYRQWNAYHNEYWPAEYFIGPHGHVRYYHFGEGDYRTDRRVIEALLRERGVSPAKVVPASDFVNQSRTPEIYLGLARGAGFTSPTPPLPNRPKDYMSSPLEKVAHWNLSGRWAVHNWYVVPKGGTGTFTLRFDAKDVYLVVQPRSPDAAIHVTVDGATPADTSDDKMGVVHPIESRLYHIVHLPKAGDHLLRLRVSPGTRLYSFTFG